ncbi:c-type cytochrome [Arhodomonas sp. SL1]|uniref:c-type cytochrome n=1 Tax=Arhodomonas sp. SL1 TaxID=3425691 RepID=UPI003F8816D5
MTRRLLAVLAALPFMVAGIAQAEGDPQAGESKSQPCVACHGADGNSGNPEWPNLAGQHEEYLYEQLRHFKDGTRENALMAGQVANLSDQDMQDLAAYYAGGQMEVGETSEEAVELGEQLWRGGIPERDVPSCAGCHGPAGDGMKGAGYPKISGQKATYLAMQLRAYRDGERSGYQNAQIMNGIAAELTDEEIEAVASFAYGLYLEGVE